MELKRMMEKLGQAKTHLELKKMIAEVDTNNSGTEHYLLRESVIINPLPTNRTHCVRGACLLSTEKHSL